MYQHDLPPPERRSILLSKAEVHAIYGDEPEDPPSGLVLVLGVVACLLAGLIIWAAIVGAAWMLIR